MSIADVIALLSLCFTCFGLGYKVGRDSNKTQKEPPLSSKRERLFLTKLISRTNRLSVVSFYNIVYHSFENMQVGYVQISCK